MYHNRAGLDKGGGNSKTTNTMPIAKGLRSPFFLIPISLFVVLTVNLYTYNTAQFYSSAKDWKGYKIIFLTESLHTPETVSALEKGGFKVISWFNTRVDFFDYTLPQLSSLPLNLIKERFEIQDPRWDAYMRGLGRYFYQPERENYPWAVYLETDLLNSTLNTSLKTILPGEGWKLENSFREGLPLYVLIMLYSGILALIVLLKKEYLLFSLGILPWIGAVIQEPLVFSLPAFISLYWWFLLITQGKEFFSYYWTYRRLDFRYREFKIKGIIYFIILTLSFLMVWLFTGSLKQAYILFLTGIVSLIMLLVYYLLLGNYINTREHRLFFLEPLVNRKSSSSPFRVPQYLFPLMLLFILPAPYVGGSLPPEPRPLPFPEEPASSINWESLERLSRLKEDKDLPNLSDYLTHRAYQEGFFYGRDYLFPESMEIIILSRYLRKNGKIEKEETVVKQFTEEWYAGIMEDAYKQGITRLLLKQEVPVRVFKLSPFTGFSIKALFVTLLGAFAFFPLFFLRSNGSSPVDCIRRKRIQ